MSSGVTEAKRLIRNPSRKEFRDLIAEMPNARLTKYDNYNVQTRVVARSKASTYIVTDRPDEHDDQTKREETRHRGGSPERAAAAYGLAAGGNSVD